MNSNPASSWESPTIEQNVDCEGRCGFSLSYLRLELHHPIGSIWAIGVAQAQEPQKPQPFRAPGSFHRRCQGEGTSISSSGRIPGMFGSSRRRGTRKTL